VQVLDILGPQRCCGLVKDQQLRALQESTGYFDELTLSRSQARGRSVEIDICAQLP